MVAETLDLLNYLKNNLKLKWIVNEKTGDTILGLLIEDELITSVPFELE